MYKEVSVQKSGHTASKLQSHELYHNPQKKMKMQLPLSVGSLKPKVYIIYSFSL